MSIVNFTWGMVVIICIFALSNALNLILPFLFAVIIHELGHIIAIKLMGGTVKAITFNLGGVIIEHNTSAMSYIEELVCVLAGPVFGLLTAVVTAHIGLGVFSGINFVISIFNLLPVRPLDGGQAVFLLISQVFLPNTAEKACAIINIAVLSAVIIAGIWLVYIKNGSFMLLLAGIALAFYSCKER